MAVQLTLNQLDASPNQLRFFGFNILVENLFEFDGIVIYQIPKGEIPARHSCDIEMTDRFVVVLFSDTMVQQECNGIAAVLVGKRLALKFEQQQVGERSRERVEREPGCKIPFAPVFTKMRVVHLGGDSLALETVLGRALGARGESVLCEYGCERIPRRARSDEINVSKLALERGMVHNTVAMRVDRDAPEKAKGMPARICGINQLPGNLDLVGGRQGGVQFSDVRFSTEPVGLDLRFEKVGETGVEPVTSAV